MKIAIYARVGSAKQTVEQQLEVLRRVAARRSMEVVEEYIDIAPAWDEKRPGMAKLLDDAREGKFDVILCWKVDCLVRSSKEWSRVIARLIILGIQIVAVEDALDTTGLEGQAQTKVLAVHAEIENAATGNRIRRKFAMQKAAGTFRGGRPRTVINKSQFTDLAARGYSSRVIARQVGCSARTVRRILSGLADEIAKVRELVVVDPTEIRRLRAEGLGWKQIAKKLRIGVGTLLGIAEEAGVYTPPARRQIVETSEGQKAKDEEVKR